MKVRFSTHWRQIDDICRLTGAERIRMAGLATLGFGVCAPLVWIFGRVIFLGWSPEPELTIDFFVTAHLGFEMFALACLGFALAWIRATLRPRLVVKLHNLFQEQVDIGRMWGVWLVLWFVTWVLFGGMTKTFDMLK